jgi:hypothetical protein
MSEIKTAAKHVVIFGGRPSDGGSIPPASTNSSSSLFQSRPVSTCNYEFYQCTVSGMIRCYPGTAAPRVGAYLGHLVI